MVKTMVKDFCSVLKTLENVGITALFRKDGSTPAVSIHKIHTISYSVKSFENQGLFHFICLDFIQYHPYMVNNIVIISSCISSVYWQFNLSLFLIYENKCLTSFLHLNYQRVLELLWQWYWLLSQTERMYEYA